MSDDQISATLAGWRKITDAAEPGPWKPAYRTWTDVGDERCAEAWIVSSAGCQVALTYVSGLLEPDGEDVTGQFIVTARTAMPRLLAVVDAMLKPHQPGPVTILGSLCKHHENHRHFSITRTEADDVRACPDCAATVFTSCAGCGPQVSADACPVRLIITRELTPCERCGGYCTNGAECAISQFLGKPADWSDHPEQEYKPTLITDIDSTKIRDMREAITREMEGGGHG